MTLLIKNIIQNINYCYDTSFYLFRSILSYLNIPVNIIVFPPVDTTAQELLFGELSWEDFEKLCLAFAVRFLWILHPFF